jgi:putative transposase
MKNWPHAPLHRTLASGTYMITSGTYKKVLHFHTPERLQFLHDQLLELTQQYGWQLHAWAVLANHYHFIAQSPQDPKQLSNLISQLHVATARYVNAIDNTPNRQVWHQFWDTHLTYQYSYLTRLNYVNRNPVKHGLVKCATDYPWCSASWFEKNSPASFRRTVEGFKIDKINVIDDF